MMKVWSEFTQHFCEVHHLIVIETCLQLHNSLVCKERVSKFRVQS
jgi:hypothetical protein